MENNIAQMFTTAGFADVDTMVEIFDDIFQHGRFNGIYLSNNVVFKVLNGSWFIDVNFAFQKSPQKKVKWC